jgi:hypothetical protein
MSNIRGREPMTTTSIFARKVLITSGTVLKGAIKN